MLLSSTLLPRVTLPPLLVSPACRLSIYLWTHLHMLEALQLELSEGDISFLEALYEPQQPIVNFTAS